jgi:PIN domain nuclease of toxin-antitoxin system
MWILLDTHAILWLLADDKRAKKRWIDIVENRSNTIYLSIASLWEIAIKSSTGKLKLHVPFADLILQNHIEQRGVILLPITPAHVIEVERLPYHHRDPFDRLIIAQAIVEGLPVISTDPKFDLYNIERI